MQIIMIGSGKGGVGKSLKVVMASYGIAVEIAEKQLADPQVDLKGKILVIDMDPQAAATRRLAAPSTPGKTMAEVLDLNSPVTLKDVIVPCGWDDNVAKGRIFVAPASVGLSVRERESHLTGSNRRLAMHLIDVLDDFDHILIDLPSGISHLMEIAAVAADGWIGTTQPEIDAFNELVRVRDTIDDEWKKMGVCPQIELMGVTVNLIEPRSNVLLHADGLVLIEDRFGDLYWEDTNTKRMIRLAELNSYSVPPQKLPNLKDHEHEYILEKCSALARRIMNHD